ncbi:MAG TPA: tail fiber protein [Herbaspirillum sp.]
MSASDSSYLGEIQLFAFGYAPMGWALCNGAMLRINEYTGLFALIGTTYGGDGKTQFQLPNFTGRAVCGQGDGINQKPRRIGDTFGENTVSLTLDQMAQHSHGLNLYRQTEADLQSNVPAEGNYLTPPVNVGVFQGGAVVADVDMAAAASITGELADHENRQPLLGLNFCISLKGEMPVFP